jgi:hypothetical protein
MVALQRVGTTIQVRPTPAERVLGLLPPLDVPLTAVKGVEVEPRPLAAVRGFRLGTSLPGVVKIGRFARRGELDYVSVRRGQPAVRLHLTGQHFRTLLVGAERPDQLAHELVELG